MSDRSKQTLTELECHDWGKPTDGSYLVQTIHRLRYKPVGDFTPEELRICIGQNVGLLFLVPLALDVVESNPLVEASLYPGDLLVVLLLADRVFWHRQSHLALRLFTVGRRAKKETSESYIHRAIGDFDADVPMR